MGRLVVLGAKYGTDPYIRPDGRKHIIVVNKDGSRTTRSYPKWLMECEFGRELAKNETVDHINRDFTDDRVENLRIVDRAVHAKEDAKRAKLVEIVCVWCGDKALKNGNDLRGNAKQSKAGPFCGKSCAGKYGSAIQNGRIGVFSPQKTVKNEHYYNKK